MQMRAGGKVVWEDQVEKNGGFSEYSKFKPSFSVLIETVSH